MTVHSKIDMVIGGLFVFTVLGLLCREKLEQLCFCFMQMEIQRSVTMAQQTIHSWRLAGEWCTPRFSRLWKVPVLCHNRPANPEVYPWRLEHNKIAWPRGEDQEIMCTGTTTWWLWRFISRIYWTSRRRQWIRGWLDDISYQSFNYDLTLPPSKN